MVNGHQIAITCSFQDLQIPTPSRSPDFQILTPHQVSAFSSPIYNSSSVVVSLVESLSLKVFQISAYELSIKSVTAFSYVDTVDSLPIL